MKKEKFIGELNFGDECYTVVTTEKMLQIGGICNAGFYVNFETEFDPDLNLDDQLQDFITDLQESGKISY